MGYDDELDIWTLTYEQEQRLNQIFQQRIRLLFFKKEQFKNLNRKELKKRGRKFTKAIKKGIKCPIKINHELEEDFMKMKFKQEYLTNNRRTK